MTLIFLRTTIATLAAFSGGALGILLSAAAQKHLKTLVYAAMGALLAVTFFDILPDAKALLAWPVWTGAVASGALLFWLVGRYIYHICPSCAVSAFDEETMQRLGQSVVLLMVALAIHSTMDGVAVVAGDAVLGRPNLAVLLAISFHKLPEGLALSLLLRGAGYAPRAALLWTFGIESTTELGGLLGVLALRHAPPALLGVVFAHVGGGFLYLIASTLGLTGNPVSDQPGPDRRPIRLPGTRLAASATLTFTVTAVLIWAFRNFAG